MQEKILYEFAVIRVVPKVEREEFINVGVVIFSKKKRYIKCIIQLNTDKLSCLSPDSDIQFIEENLQAFKQIVDGKSCASSIAQLDEASRFRWLTATRSTIIQSSKIHPGFTTDLDLELNRIFERFVQ